MFKIEDIVMENSSSNLFFDLQIEHNDNFNLRIQFRDSTLSKFHLYRGKLKRKQKHITL